MPPPASLYVVLHQVQHPDNLGAVARVMGNFGVDRLVVSDPQLSAWEGAARLATEHSAHVLAGLTRVPSLQAALQGAVYACGTTFRPQVGTRRALTPADAAAQLHERARSGPVALVMGGERRGLSDEELGACDAFLTIETDPRTPSMNLAQATAVTLYEVARQHAPPSQRGHGDGSTTALPEAPPARLETVNAMESAMRDVLTRAGFLNPQQPELILRELVHSLRRGGLSQREVELWTAAFKQLGRPR